MQKSHHHRPARNIAAVGPQPAGRRGADMLNMLTAFGQHQPGEHHPQRIRHCYFLPGAAGCALVAAECVQLAGGVPVNRRGACCDEPDTAQQPLAEYGWRRAEGPQRKSNVSGKLLSGSSYSSVQCLQQSCNTITAVVVAPSGVMWRKYGVCSVRAAPCSVSFIIEQQT